VSRGDMLADAKTPRRPLHYRRGSEGVNGFASSG
jgi:hypothetical protein